MAVTFPHENGLIKSGFVAEKMKRPGFIAKAGLSGCLAACVVCVLCVSGVCTLGVCQKLGSEPISDSSYGLNAATHRFEFAPEANN